MVEVPAPVTAPAVETSSIDVPAPTTAANGEVPNESLPPTTAASTAPAPRRDTAPVDIAIADMVVAALSLANNGADDATYGPQPSAEEEFQWAEATDPASY